ncbi:MAG TPA: hypothetical protein DCS23_00950 [Candidatus Yonathbacteria bacterium]|nr:hypothetical protein [Candidatus Yonathbacteria bacterium]
MSDQSGRFVFLSRDTEIELLKKEIQQLHLRYEDALTSLRSTILELEESRRRARMLEQEVKETRKLAVYDNLTNLFSRYEMEGQINHHFSLLLRAEHMMEKGKLTQTEPEHFSILFIDLDGFKEINDTHGHQCGDRALRTFSSLLKQSFREADIISRWGGDEFVVLLPGVNREKTVKIISVLQDNLTNVSIPCDDGSYIPLRASIGIASTSEISAPRTLEEMIKRADNEMYTEKTNNRGK